MSNLRLIGLVIALCALAAGLSGVGNAVTPPGTVVMSNLENPRHLAFGPEGGLYVAEAGHGGAGPCIFIRGENQCAGPSGAVSVLWRGVQKRVVRGLPSYAPESGAGATGPHGVSLHGRGNAYVTVGLGGEGDPIAFRAIMGDGFGRTVVFKPNGGWRYLDDLAAYEAEHNPDSSPVPDSNPYGILAGAGGRLVVDSGGNDLLRVRANGRISTVGVFPSRPQGRSTDSVPTAVAVGPDGAYYVGEYRAVRSRRERRTSTAWFPASRLSSSRPASRPSSTSAGARTAGSTSSSSPAGRASAGLGFCSE